MADALDLASLRAELADRGTAGEPDGGDGLRLDTGPAGRLAVTATVRLGGAGIVATVESEPFVPDRQQDAVRTLLRPQPFDFALHRDPPSRRSTVALHRHLPSSDLPQTALRLLRYVEAARSALREVDRELVLADPSMRAIREAQPLISAERTGDAIRVLRRGLADLPRHAPLRARGWLMAILGHLLDGAGDVAGGRPLLDEGVEVLAAQGDGWAAARVLGDQVQVLINRRRPQEALAVCDRVDELLGRAGTTDDLAWATLRRAQALIELRRPGEARTLLLDLERHLVVVGHETTVLANTRFALGLALQKTDNPDGAIEFYLAAERIHRDLGDTLNAFRSSLNRAGALIDAGRPAEALEVVRYLRATRTAWGHLAGQRDDTKLDTTEGAALTALGRHDDARRPAARAAAGAEPGSASAAVARHNLGRQAYVAGDPAAAAEHIEAAMRDYERLGMAEELAVAQRDLAGLHARQIEEGEVQSGSSGPMTTNTDWADIENLHADAMAALRGVERPPAHLDSVVDRERWAARVSTSLGAAVMTSHGTERHRLALELLEQGRAQGLPDVSASTVAAARAEPLPPDEAPAEVVPSEEELRLAGVRAALHDLAVAPTPVGDVGAETRLVGGPRSWRWTLWYWGGSVLWAVLRPDGEVASGAVVIDVAGPDFLHIQPATAALFADKAGPHLERWRRATGEGVGEHEWGAAVPGDLLVADEDDAEPEVAWEVGRRLIPPPLLAELRRRLDRPELGPLPLVVAPSPGLAHLPYGLLAITPPGDAPPLGRRLVEAAVVTLAPPSALATDLRTRPPASPPFDVRLAVVDPVGDLPGAAELATRAGLDPVRPDRAGVVEALREIPAGDPGVLVWAGRAVAPEDGNPLGIGLRLRGRRADGTDERLTTGEVVLDGLPAPRRVVLLGCSTLGAARAHEPDRPKHLADAEEWWGFPVVLLHAGASAVLATTWRTIDCPATAAIAAELVEAARTAPDLAAALREVQLCCLGAWARQRQLDRSFTFTAADRHPHLWAAWAVTGAQRG